ncbi:MAG: hypothetical protein E7582_02150 [Ruminococcaceae bacterium]|nr:hypothetical protein [Oscillospiraceae bacterium]
MKRDNHGFDDALADIVYTFAEYKDKYPPNHPDTLKLVRIWQKYMTENHYECTDELLECLGRMYRGDDFAPKIDVFGKGTAHYMSDAILEYCKNK